MGAPQHLNNTSTHPNQILSQAIAYFLIDAQIGLSHLAGISEIIGRLDPFFKILSSWISCQFLILLITPIGPLILQYLVIPVARWLCSLIGASPGMHRPDITIAFAACLSIFCETLLYLFKRILFFSLNSKVFTSIATRNHLPILFLIMPEKKKVLIIGAGAAGMVNWPAPGHIKS